MPSAIDTLALLLRPRLPDAGAAPDWLSATFDVVGLAPGARFDRDAFLVAFSSAARSVGKVRLGLSDAERAGLRACGIDWALDDWGVDEMARVLLLVGAASRDGEAIATLVAECYARADNRERQAVLRALPLLPEGHRFVPLSVEACRSSVQTIFEAICCDNPFPARHFPDPSLHQMILKALFTGAPVARIVGLAARVTPELLRMVQDYASERRAAGRTVPADVGRVLALAPSHAER